MHGRRLTQAETAILRRALVAKRRELLKDLDVRGEEAREGPVDSAELEDVAEGVIEDRQRASLTEHDRELLAEVDRALAKIPHATFGICERSGRPIPYERLKIIPWARYAVDAAVQIERSKNGPVE